MSRRFGAPARTPGARSDLGLDARSGRSAGVPLRRAARVTRHGAGVVARASPSAPAPPSRRRRAWPPAARRGARSARSPAPTPPPHRRPRLLRVAGDGDTARSPGAGLGTWRPPLCSMRWSSRAMAGRHAPPPSEPRPTPAPDPAGAGGGGGEQEQRRRRQA